jgi:hypothetical protein
MNCDRLRIVNVYASLVSARRMLSSAMRREANLRGCEPKRAPTDASARSGEGCPRIFAVQRGEQAGLRQSDGAKSSSSGLVL